MIILTLKIEETEKELGSEIKIHINAHHEGYATELEADYVEKLVVKMASATKEVAETIGPCIHEDGPIKIFKRLLTDEETGV